MMRPSIRRAAATAAFFAMGLVAVTGVAADEARPGGGTGFSGSWALVAAKDDVAEKTKRDGWNVLGGAEGPGGGSLRTGGGGFDLPLEVMADARRLAVSDDGMTLRVAYPSGRRRAFVTDGVARVLDDGDGPANVTARRKGAVVTVASEWLRGYKLRETWELSTDARRLVVSGRLKGRESQAYVRTYEPASPGEVVATPAAGGPSAGIPAATGPAGTPADAAEGAGGPEAPFVDHLAECSIRPPRNATPEELARLVRVTQQEAAKKAVASLSPLKATDVISSDVEAFEGCLAWPFTLRLPGKKGVQEVFVDAGNGEVVRSEFVPASVPESAPESP
jgi:hypothetical protein